MTKMRCLHIENSISLENAWQELEDAGIVVAYSEESEGQNAIHIFYSEEIQMPAFDWIAASEDYLLPETDWKSQWQTHGMNFKEGFVHVDLSQFSPCKTILKLEPGPGFGDLSHTTTLLILRLMPKYLIKQEVIDIGCGSGILTLAALALGSHLAYGIDIDAAAVEHSQSNARINQLESHCGFQFASDYKKNSCREEKLICMNMIMCEQEAAWQSMRLLHKVSAKILTSGITQEDRAAYLAKTEQWGWQLLEEISENGWLAFCFKQA